MVDTDVIWNFGGYKHESTFDHNMNNTLSFYESERFKEEYYFGVPEWTKNNSPNYHNGIGLIYASDLGYAFGGNDRKMCVNENLTLHTYSISYWTECLNNNWITPALDSGLYWTIVFDAESTYAIWNYLFTQDSDFNNGIGVGSSVDSASFVEPTLYLKPIVKIKLDSSDNYGSINNPFQIIS